MIRNKINWTAQLLTVLFTALLTPFLAQASDITGAQAPLLEKTQLDAKSQEALKKRCDETGIMTIPNRRNCDRIVAEAKLSQAAFDRCYQKNEAVGYFLECIRKSQGRDFPLSYLTACSKARGKDSSQPQVCEEYLANTDASFDEEAFKFCVEAHGGAFEKSKSCLNAVRDRQVDVQNLKRTCIENLSMSERFNDCVNRATDKAVSLKSCAKPKAASSAAAFQGTR